MRYFPVQLDLRGRPALLVGGGEEVHRKVEQLLEAGALVTVIAPKEPCQPLRELAERGLVRLLARAATTEDIEGKAIVFVGTAEEGIGQAWFDRASSSGLLLCTLDRPELSTFVNPAVANVSGLSIAIGTAGKSPGIPRRIREDLEAVFSAPRFEQFLSLLGSLRDSLPRGERATRLSKATEGFGLDAQLRFPKWFDEGDAPPSESTE